MASRFFFHAIIRSICTPTPTDGPQIPRPHSNPLQTRAVTSYCEKMGVDLGQASSKRGSLEEEPDLDAEFMPVPVRLIFSQTSFPLLPHLQALNLSRTE